MEHFLRGPKILNELTWEYYSQIVVIIVSTI